MQCDLLCHMIRCSEVMDVAKGEKMLRIVMALVLVVCFAGCNTMAGFGRDVERLGDKIEDKAERRR